ncbi:sucrase ferredoxin [Amycolatopsis sp. PS_44_ISF1]|uniref:sucrase ferredoxin n=1 Tax=Amycolatopsis sp. PS_44_ISF1 TaxID=2974917 RepID=UPI0028DF082C|nr:sucrase ferredoxin [Amycolatopsis sp. PS_44_ISF1]MDT8915175.1 hypothetical protein [Amycolatopsis sp. PS_44_ISF1]
MTGPRAPQWRRCAELADAAGDALAGTAPPASRWLLIEHPGSWSRKALDAPGLDPAAVAAVTAWAGPADARIVLIRRPGPRVRDTASRQWFLVDARPGREAIRTGEFHDARGLAAVPADQGRPFTGPLTLVCAHGRHDACCAVRGRPLVAALAAARPETTWECTHLGGCRFAPTAVVLPHGFTFGRVPPADAAGIVDDYVRGRLDTRWLRGRSAFPPAVQAAQHHARRATGACGIDELRPSALEPAGAGRWRVEFTDPGCSVLLQEHRTPVDRPLTCAAAAPGQLREFALLDVRTSAPGRSGDRPD